MQHRANLLAKIAPGSAQYFNSNTLTALNMPTGDLHNAFAQLVAALRSVKYPAPVDEAAVRSGEPQQFLPMLHFVLLDFSRVVAKKCTAQVSSAALLGA